jgi:flagellar biosynthesis component FlhA
MKTTPTQSAGSLHPVVSRRRRKNRIVMAIAAAMLVLIGVMEGWKMVLVTIGLAVALVCVWSFIGWYHDD